MRNRDYKKFAPNTFYHIYNRGNNREKIFFEPNDYRAFLFRLGLALGFENKELDHNLLYFPKSRIRLGAKKGLYELHSFCLMPNHFHLLIEQKTDKSLSNLMLRFSTSFSMYMNKKYGRVGHIFQDQFKAVSIESDKQMRWVCSYIHMNPVKDGLVTKPEQYTWSSFQDLIEKRDLPIISKNMFPKLFGNTSNFYNEIVRLEPKIETDPEMFFIEF